VPRFAKREFNHDLKFLLRMWDRYLFINLSLVNNLVDAVGSMLLIKKGNKILYGV
jgi:hypothetical protein